MSPEGTHLTQARIHTGRLARNLRLLQELAGDRPLWPAVKANAYGHGAELVARELEALGCETLCVAHAAEAVALRQAGIRARLVLLSATLPEHAEACVAHALEPTVCDAAMLEALAAAAGRAGRRVDVHVKVDTGMGRIGVRPEDTLPFLERCRVHPEIRLRGLTSHFPRADEADKSLARRQCDAFQRLRDATKEHGIQVYHLANSAGIFDLPEGLQDAARPGIALYGLAPSAEIANPRVAELEPVLEWATRVTFVKDVPAGTGLSYGHRFVTGRPSRIATVPVGYGDGLARGLSSRASLLLHGRRCPQVGIITMDQCLVDVTDLGDRVAPGDEALLIGRQGGEEIRAEELAATLGSIAYEIVTAIATRVPRIPVGDAAGA